MFLNYLEFCTYQKMKVNMKSQRYEWPDTGQMLCDMLHTI